MPGLKTIEELDIGCNSNCTNNTIDELRQEAIEWIKEIDRQYDEHIKSNDKINYMKGENYRCELSLANGMHYRRNWIIMFFDIKKEDLKCPTKN